LVTVITIFLNEERFLAKAVESVLTQTYPHWELLLCDDGSTDASPGIARGYAEKYPGRIRYLRHDGGENRGMSATRNLGLAHAEGKYVAFLDADDLWLPEKLERQLATLQRHPDATMVFGPTMFWHSWTGNLGDGGLDGTARLGRIRTGEIVRGEAMLREIVLDRSHAIATCSPLMRREAVRTVGGFEDSFTGLFEDQAFFAKFLLAHDVLVTDECLDLYRQHPDSCCAIATSEMNTLIERQRFYLEWLAGYMEGVEADESLRRLVDRELRLHRYPRLVRGRRKVREVRRDLLGRASKVAFTVGRRIMPAPIRKALWNRLHPGSTEPMHSASPAPSIDSPVE
jgi:glycosyltransferase involved in cell wall biosynthesis